MTGFGNEREYVEEILREFRSRIPDAVDFARQNRVLLVNARNGRSIDIGLAGIPFEQQMIERASPFAFAPGISLVPQITINVLLMIRYLGSGPGTGGRYGWVKPDSVP